MAFSLALTSIGSKLATKSRHSTVVRYVRTPDFGRSKHLADAANGRFGEAALQHKLTQRMTGLGRKQPRIGFGQRQMLCRI